MTARLTDTVQSLAFEGVGKRYGEQWAIQDATLAVHTGEFVTLLGPSGSGKSTLLGLAVGSLQADAGRVLLGGKDAAHLRTHQREIGMVFQKYALFPHKTVRQNIEYPLRVRKRPRSEVAAQVEHWLALTGLGPHAEHYPAELSGGQAQRVSLARALCFAPSLLLLDEPLAALDKNLRLDMQDEIYRLQRQSGVPALYVTHDQEEAMRLSDRIAVCRDGRIVAQGTPEQLYQSPPGQWVASFLGDANLFAVQRAQARADGRSTVRTVDGLGFEARNPHDLDVRTACVVLRPEDCAIAPEAQGAIANPARVEQVSFLGGQSSVRLTLANGRTLIARVPGWQPLHAGQRVFWGYRPGGPVLTRAES